MGHNRRQLVLKERSVIDEMAPRQRADDSHPCSNGDDPIMRPLPIAAVLVIPAPSHLLLSSSVVNG